MSWFEIHHGYWGIGLLLLGFILIFYNIYAAITVMLLGQWIYLDDFYQEWRRTKDPHYFSPLHRWCYKVLGWFK